VCGTGGARNLELEARAGKGQARNGGGGVKGKKSVSMFLATCARLSGSHSTFESTLNSAIVSYRIIKFKLKRRRVRSHFKNFPKYV